MTRSGDPLQFQLTVSDRKRSLSEKQRVEPVAYHEEAAGAFASIALFFRPPPNIKSKHILF
jgi:hypothetical protein